MSEKKQKRAADPDLEAERKAKDPVQTESGGVQTTDPSFADGAQEVDSWSNQPREEDKK